jgi:hypothetical protein
MSGWMIALLLWPAAAFLVLVLNRGAVRLSKRRPR